MNKSGIAVYGSIEIQRVYCRKCKRMSLVVDGLKQCCEEVAHSKLKERQKICEHYGKRTEIKAKARKIAIKAQNGICPYCDNSFGYFFERGGLVSKSTIHIDHKSPFSYSRNNTKDNLTACCSICNILKSDFVFESLETLKEYIYEKRKEKGYKVL